MALTEKRVLKEATVDYQSGTIIIVHADQVLKDGELIAERGQRQDFREHDLDELTKQYPDLAGKYARGVLGWTAASAKAAKARRDADDPSRLPPDERAALPHPTPQPKGRAMPVRRAAAKKGAKK